MPIVVIDSGHEPSALGATGTCNKNELVYNDQLVQQIAQTLGNTYQIILTRQPGLDVQTDIPNLENNLPNIGIALWNSKKSLFARAAIANLNHANVFISIHHDSTSTEQQVIDPTLCEHHGGINLKPDFKNQYRIGYNIFFDNADSTTRRAKSLLLAENIGKQLRAIGRIPSNYHVYPVDKCKSCYPVNKVLGVWNEDLAVLRNTNMPAVLIEVGNIVDPEDEQIINTNDFRIKFSAALKQALNEYFLDLQNLKLPKQKH